MEEFNSADFFRCHETLEALWLKEDYPLRLFYQGILKVAVGFLHLQRRNKRGAVAKLREGLDTLEPFGPQFMGVEVGDLRSEARTWLEKLKDTRGLVPAESLPRINLSKSFTETATDAET
ncbi:MAG: DUF309 domain-containing protein [Chloroflexi bacterium]|nr:DUF309 domain-containing protein [Chloroflexota bacterium]MCZ6866659.1 DUF309 domain-containing protein [Chloroflexota bacterium]